MDPRQYNPAGRPPTNQNQSGFQPGSQNQPVYNPGDGRLPTPAADQVPAPTTPQPLQSPPPAYQQPYRPSAQQPVQPPNQPAFDPSYLDQIAPVTAKPKRSGLAVFGLIGIVIVGAFLALFAIMNSSTNGQVATANLAGRIDSLQKVADAQQKHLAANDIVVANATLATSLTTMKGDLESITNKDAVKQSKDDADTEKSYAEKLGATLENSYQRGTIDRTYKVQMTYELTVLKSMLTKYKANNQGKATQEFVDKSVKNIDTILEQYNDFSSSKT